MSRACARHTTAGPGSTSSAIGDRGSLVSSSARRRIGAAAELHDQPPVDGVIWLTASAVADLALAGADGASARVSLQLRRETGGGGKPARFCQEETHVLAEQFSSMEHDAFRVPYLSDKTLETAFNGQAVDRGEVRPSASNDFIEERRTARRKLMSVPSSAATTRSSGNSRGSGGRWVFAEVERDLISGAHPGGALPRGQILGAEALGPPERAPWGRLHGSRASFMSIRGLKPSPYRVFLHEYCFWRSPSWA